MLSQYYTSYILEGLFRCRKTVISVLVYPNIFCLFSNFSCFYSVCFYSCCYLFVAISSVRPYDTQKPKTSFLSHFYFIQKYKSDLCCGEGVDGKRGFLWTKMEETSPGINLCMRPANERRRYFVTSPLIGWAQTQIDPCIACNISRTFTSGDWFSIGISIIKIRLRRSSNRLIFMMGTPILAKEHLCTETVEF